MTAALTTFAAGTACIGVTALASLYAGQRRLVWIGQLANNATVADPRELSPNAEVVRLSEEAVGCYFAPDGDDSAHAPRCHATTIVYFHGNGDQIGWGGAFLGPAFARRGVGFFAVEYPGYGLASAADGSSGPSEAGVLAAAEALLAHLEARLAARREAKEQAEAWSGVGGGASAPATRHRAAARASMVLVGQSIGCAPALEMVNRGWGSGLVLLSPFTSLMAMAGDVLPWLAPALRLLPFLLRDKLDNTAAAARLPAATPVLVVHGTADEVVPFAQGEQLAEHFRQRLGGGGGGGDGGGGGGGADAGDKEAARAAASASVTFEPLPGVGHNDLFEGDRFAELVGRICAFAAAAVGSKSSHGNGNDFH